jgi:DnaJ-class molecular chaperone
MTPTKLDRKEIEEAVRKLENDWTKLSLEEVDTILFLVESYLDNSLSERPMMSEDEIKNIVRKRLDYALSQTTIPVKREIWAEDIAHALSGHILAPEKVCNNCGGTGIIDYNDPIANCMCSRKCKLCKGTGQASPQKEKELDK